MLEQSQQRHRCEALGRRIRQREQQRARRRLAQGPAGTVVGNHAPAPEMRRHPPREPAVRSHQRSSPARLLQHLTERQGDRLRLLGRIGQLERAHTT